MIDTEIEDKYYSFIREHGKEPNVFILHPFSLVELIKSFSWGDINLISINESEDTVKYRGVKILQSPDIPKSSVFAGFVV